MLCLKVEPHLAPYPVDVEDSLQSLQNEVDGFIEVVYPLKDEPIAIICNEEGKLLNLEPNRTLYDDQGYPLDVICGTFLVVGLEEDHFTSLDQRQIHLLSMLLED